MHDAACWCCLDCLLRWTIFMSLWTPSRQRDKANMCLFNLLLLMFSYCVHVNCTMDLFGPVTWTKPESVLYVALVIYCAQVYSISQNTKSNSVASNGA